MAKSGQTGELLSTSLTLREHVPVALGFPFFRLHKKKSLEKVICWPVLYLFCTSGVDLVIYHSANVSEILWRDFWGTLQIADRSGRVLPLPCSSWFNAWQTQYWTTSVLYAHIFFIIVTIWRKVKLPLSIVLRFLLGQPVHYLKLCSYSGCFLYGCVQRFRDLLGDGSWFCATGRVTIMLYALRRRASFGSWLLNE